MTESHEDPEKEKQPCPHEWKENGFSGPYWAYLCQLCGEEEFHT